MRIRHLAALLALAAAIPTAVAATLAVHWAIPRALGTAAAPEAAAIARSAAAAVLAVTGIAAVLAALLALVLGGRLAAALDRLRAGLAHRESGAPAPRLTAATPLEIAALAAAIDARRHELERAAAALGGERDVVDALVGAVGGGIIQLGAGGRVVRANPAARTFLGLPEDAVGRPIESLVRHPELRALLRTDGAPPREIGILGRQLLVAARAIGGERPVVQGDAAPGPAAVVLVDLTELRRLEGVRRDFVANVSHELKTPLTSIRGYAETLLDPELPPATARQFLETIHRNAARLQRIVDGLLDLSRLESGGWRPELRAVDVAAAARDAWAACEERAREKRIRFDAPGPGPHAGADPVALAQVFANLFDNALRHTPSGGRIAVELREDAAAGRLVVEVQDTGSGIPTDALARVFERFYRVDPARSRAEGGTGLGLAIVKHLIEAMGGDVVAESVLGHGTTIRFRIPLAARPALEPAGPPRPG